MKNFLIYIVVSSMMSITGGLMYAKYYLSPKIKDLLQTKASAALGTPVQIHDLRVIILPKFSLAATGVKFTMTDPNLKVDVPKLSIEFPINKSLFSRTSTFGPIVVRMEEARLNFETTKAPIVDTSKLEEQIVTHTQIKFARDLSMSLSVSKAKFKFVEKSPNGEVLNETTLDPLNFDLDIPGIEKEWSTSIKTHLAMTHPQIGLPVSLETQFSYKNQILSLSSATGNIAGIVFKLSGEQNFADKVANWKAVVDTADFSKIKPPPEIPYLKNIAGELHADLNANLAPNSDWNFFGQLHAKSFSAETNWSNEPFQIAGPIAIDCDSQFSFSKFLKIESLTLHSKLDDLEMKVTNYFLKPKGIAASLDLTLTQSNEIVYLSSFNFNLLNLKVDAKGEVAVSQNARSEVAFDIDPINLSGWENYVTPLSAGPLAGLFAAKFSVIKEIAEPAVKFDFKNLKVDNMKGALNFASQSFEAKGNVDAHFQMSGIYPYGQSILDSPLDISGGANLMLSDLKYVRTAEIAPTEASAISKTEIASETHLVGQKFSLFRGSKLKLNIQSQHLVFKDFIGDDLVSAFSLENQNFTGTVKINKFAGGDAEFKNLKIDFKNAVPMLGGEIDLKNADANILLSNADKDSKNVIAGQLTGQNLFEFPVGDIDKIRASGRLNLKNASVGGMNYDAWINEGITHLSGLQTSKHVVQPSTSEASLIFTLVDSNINVQDLKVSSSSRNEAQLKGVFSFKSSDLNLSGTAHFAESPVGGDVAAANADPQGRFTLPFQVSGSIKKPVLGFAQNTVEEILKKTLSFVAKRETDKIKRAITGEKEPVAKTPVDEDDREDADSLPPKLPEKKKPESVKSRFNAIFGTH